MRIQKIISTALFAFSFIAGSHSNLSAQSQSDSVIYRQAITQAMSPEPSKIYDSLVQIVPSNKKLSWKAINGEDYILVATWTSKPQFYQPYIDSAYYPTKQYEIWITTSPQLLERFRKDKPKDTVMRLRQMLGLPPNAQYTHFVEFWVRPADLFRPCPDNEITDGTCGLCFPATADSTYKAWINNGRISRYYPCELYNKYPWTQLGYTFDWNPKNKRHIGLSEFVIKPFSNVVVNAVYTTQQYLNKKN